jgi:hypothetical protein
MLKSYNSPGIDKILAGLIQAGANISCSEILIVVINFVWNKEELPQRWKELAIYESENTYYINFISMLMHMYRMSFNILPSKLTP